LSLVVAVAPCVPGFLDAATGGKIVVPDVFKTLYTYSWFITFAIGFGLYAVLMAGHPSLRSDEPGGRDGDA
jgi:nucleobase:cation symporter-1, NCS1 family